MPSFIVPHHTFPANDSESERRKEMDLKSVLNLYDLELSRINQELQLKSGERVGLAMPEGLRSIQAELVRYLETELCIKIVVLGDVCFGACDLKCDAFLSAGIGKAIHLGNLIMPSRLPKNSIQVSFVPMLVKSMPDEILPDAVEALRGRGIESVGLAASAQFLPNLNMAKEVLEKTGFTVFVGEGSKRVTGAGHVLGCDVSACTEIASKVDCFALFEDGEFHAPFIALSAKRDVYCFDILTGDMRHISYHEELRKVCSARRSNLKGLELGGSKLSIGVILSSKRGQTRDKAASKIERLALKNGHAVIVFEEEYISIERLSSSNFDVLVNTACPRILDYRSEVEIPTLSVTEALEFLSNGVLAEDRFVVDEIRS